MAEHDVSATTSQGGCSSAPSTSQSASEAATAADEMEIRELILSHDGVCESERGDCTYTNL